jgi:hypothetical protein
VPVRGIVLDKAPGFLPEDVGCTPSAPKAGKALLVVVDRNIEGVLVLVLKLGAGNDGVLVFTPNLTVLENDCAMVVLLNFNEM